MTLRDEQVAERLCAVVRAGRPRPRPGALGVGVALAELDAWLTDQRQWTDAQRRDWTSLLQDVTDAFAALGHSAGVAVRVAGAPAPLALIDEHRGRLEHRPGRGVDAAMREQLREAAADLRAALRAGSVVEAAWDDLVRAAGRGLLDREDDSAAVVADVAAVRGVGWDAVAERVGGILADDKWAVERARADVRGAPAPSPPQSVSPRGAGAPAVERMTLARTLLGHEPQTGRCVVWLAFPGGHVDQFVLAVGDSLTLFEGRWLASVLEHWEDSQHAHAAVPPELAQARSDVLRSWRHSDDDIAFAVLRVDVGQVAVADAVRAARESAEALLRLAALHTATRPPWREGPFMLFVDGRLDWYSVGLDRLPAGSPGGGPDHVSAAAAELADLVGPHLPVTDSGVHDALQLLRWLDDARETWDPARLALCYRVLEQAARWAGTADPQRFALAHLAAPWAWREIVGAVDAAGRAAVYGIDSAPRDGAREAFLEAVGPGGLLTQSGLRDTLNHRAVIERLDWLLSWQHPSGDSAAALRTLSRRLKDGRSAARWMRRLTVDFDRRLRRAKRTRNATVHGGPIASGTVEDVLEFIDSLAVDALNCALHTRMREGDIGDAFARRTSRFERCMADLDAGVQPARALFWD